jgi:ABC-type dipeptide/oligopeptide/nickel transport system ATPase component
VSDNPLLAVEGLSIGYTPRRAHQPVRIVRNVTFEIGRREIVGLVGESGSGKTQTARSVLRMTTPPLQTLGGRIVLDGTDLVALAERDMRQLRGSKVAMIFQDPRSSLNPLMRVGDQLARVYALHQRIASRAAWQEALDMLRRVGIAGPERVARSYPHQLSGGMCQRVMIGLALGIRPRLLIADEPTTGLDVTIQAQILDLIQQTRAETGASILLITHDLGVVAETCQRVMVMLDGKIVEIAGVNDLFQQPMHPYTVRLLRATPGRDAAATSALPGSGSPVELHVGAERLSASLDDVALDEPGLALREVAPGHLVLCTVSASISARGRRLRWSARVALASRPSAVA